MIKNSDSQENQQRDYTQVYIYNLALFCRQLHSTSIIESRLQSVVVRVEYNYRVISFRRFFLYICISVCVCVLLCACFGFYRRLRLSGNLQTRPPKSDKAQSKFLLLLFSRESHLNVKQTYGIHVCVCVCVCVSMYVANVLHYRISCT